MSAGIATKISKCNLLVDVVRVPSCNEATVSAEMNRNEGLYLRLSFLYRLFLLTGAAAGGEDGPASDMVSERVQVMTRECERSREPQMTRECERSREPQK